VTVGILPEPEAVELQGLLGGPKVAVHLALMLGLIEQANIDRFEAGMVEAAANLSVVRAGRPDEVVDIILLLARISHQR